MSLVKKFVGDRAFYKMTLAVAVPIMIQNFITNFVSMLDNLMVGSLGTEQMSGVSIVNQLIFVFSLAVLALSAVRVFSPPNSLARTTTTVSALPSDIS